MSRVAYDRHAVPFDDNDVSLWVAKPQNVHAPDLIAFYEGLLDVEEYRRYQRFHFPEHRKQFLIAHALVRLALSCYAPIAPADWRFVRNRHGRPEIANATARPLRFSLSHTDGIALCAVTLEYDIGADIENIQRMEPDRDLIHRVLSDTERSALQQQAVTCQTGAFLKYWTLKEAYLKARGIGLSVLPDRISFDLKQARPTALFHDSLNDDPANWGFASLQISRHHIAAVAVRGCANPHLVLCENRLI